MLQKVMKQGRNGNVGEFRHMTTSFFPVVKIPASRPIGPEFIIER